jgi:hypothetical protein
VIELTGIGCLGAGEAGQDTAAMFASKTSHPDPDPAPAKEHRP